MPTGYRTAFACVGEHYVRITIVQEPRGAAGRRFDAWGVLPSGHRCPYRSHSEIAAMLDHACLDGDREIQDVLDRLL